MNRFSSTDRWGSRLSSWYTACTPAARSAAGVGEATSRPSIRKVPESRVIAPVSTLMSVDFPAPFSPARQWTWPGYSVSETFVRA
jgi:hypothetical protein